MEKKKIIWLVVSCLMVLSLVFASCGPAPTITPTPTQAPTVTPTPTQAPTVTPTPTQAPTAGPEMVKLTLKKLDGTVVEKTVEKPRYGGVFNWGYHAVPTVFDAIQGQIAGGHTLIFTNEVLVGGNWAMGPEGTGEVEWSYVSNYPFKFLVGVTSESWQLENPSTLVFHIRKGIHFSLNPKSEASRLVNGRELTAEDWAYSLNRLWDSRTSYQNTSLPRASYIKQISARDKWTLVIEATEPAKLGPVYEKAAQYGVVVPQEVVAKYGDMTDWRNAVGTGPWILTEYVAGSSATLIRNPDYWQKDPLFPDNQIPYMDSIRQLYILDMSTRLAALRTGKFDMTGGTSWGPLPTQDRDSVIKTNPQLKWKTAPGDYPATIFWRVDKKPFSDVRVRRALTIGTDRRAIADLYFGPGSLLFTDPIHPFGDAKDIFVPLEQLPESNQELYKYDPEIAKNLLKEAGYPNGFTTEILTTAANVDLLSIVKDQWSKIGVNLQLNIKDSAAATALVNAKTYDMYMLVSHPAIAFSFLRTRPGGGGTANLAQIDDPKNTAVVQAVDENYFDMDKKAAILKPFVPYWIDQAWYLAMPTDARSVVWWPWVKGYQGEDVVGYAGMGKYFVNYIWLDQDLKQKMQKGK